MSGSIPFTGAAKIESVTIGSGSSSGFVNSFIGASAIGKITLSSVQTDNGGEPFGVVGLSIGSVRVLKPAFEWLPGGPAVQGMGDFQIQLYESR
jgi:hypothetical protein